MLVMFVCQANVGRSQVAEAYFERLSQHEVCSSGLRVDEEMARNKPASAKMKDNSRHSLPYMLERGIDISEKERTQITPELIAAADRIVAILPPEEVSASLSESGKLTVWDLPDPVDHPDAAWNIFDVIHERVRALVDEIG